MTDDMQIHSCPGMDAWLADEEIPFGYSPKFREYFVSIPNVESYIALKFCPSCGRQLPTSLRGEWFDRIFAMDLDGPEDPRVPAEMRSDAWWRNRIR